MANPIFLERLLNNIEQCLREAENCARLEHNGMVGTVRQLLVEKILQPLLPEGIHIGTGKITDHKGNLSRETDVVIYDRRCIPPLMYDAKSGVFPIESVYYAIEVKSTLDSDNFEDAIIKGAHLRSLAGPPPHSAVFAFRSNLKIAKDSERFIQRQKDLISPPPVNVFCIVGREYGYWSKRWNLFSPPTAHAEIVCFVVGIVNTLFKESKIRDPDLEPGWYFFPES